MVILFEVESVGRRVFVFVYFISLSVILEYMHVECVEVFHSVLS